MVSGITQLSPMLAKKKRDNGNFLMNFSSAKKQNLETNCKCYLFTIP
jgi:hypothetical protein